MADKNRIEFDASGFERGLRDKMQRLGRNTTREVDRIGNGAKGRAVDLAAKRTGAMADTIEWTRDGDTEGTLSVGTDYAKFQEFGSAHNAPHPFMRPALDEAGGNLRSPGYN